VYSAEEIAPNPISSDTLERADPSTTAQVSRIVPLAGGRGHKRPPPATRWSKPIPSVDQVMTQVELPPYRGPRSPLDLVAIEVIYGRMFVVFRHISQAAVVSAAATEDDRSMKRSRQPSLRKVLVPR
jgi:hypothetical protein